MPRMPVTPTNYAPAVQRQRALVASLRPSLAAKPMTGPSPVARLRLLPTVRQATYLHGIVRLDDCGRIRDAAVFSAVGFEPGTPISATVEAGRLLISHDEASSVTLDGRGRVALSETHRRLLGLTTGSPVVISGASADRTVVVQPTDVLDRVVV